MSPRQAKHSAHGEQGSVLVVVLLLMSVLVVGAVECLRLARLESASSRVFSSAFQDAGLSESGLAFAKYLLYLDAGREGGDPSDHRGEAWAGFFEQDEHPAPELESGQVNGTIEDEGGKFPVNSLITEDGTTSPQYRDVLTRLLRFPPFALEEADAEAVVQSLLDWLDPDELPTGEFGAETDAYRAQGKAYACPNGPMRSLSELLKVRGVTGTLYRGTDEHPGLKDLLSVHNPGGININTASPLLLAAMAAPTVRPQTAREFAESMVSYREDSDHFDFLAERDWYRNRMAGYNDMQLPTVLVETGSSVFSVNVRAGQGQAGSALFAVLKRSAGEDGVSLETIWRESR